MERTEILKEWTDKAEKDLEAAKMHTSHGTAYEVPAFMCHQAVEKALIGYIYWVSDEKVSTHDLPYLGRWAEKTLPELGTLKAELALVNRYYVEMTYPDDLTYAVSADSVSLCIDIAERVLRMIRNAGGI